jgi:hypothetical protein
LEGKKGTIFSWSESKQALVMVEGESSPFSIAYAEMELIKPAQNDSNWETDLSWNTAQQTYYYFQKEDKIYSDKWPAGLTLTPSSHELSPIEFMTNWEQKFAEQLLQLFPQAIPASSTALVGENERLREQLAEAEATIEAMIKACENTAASSDFSAGNISEISSPEDTVTPPILATNIEAELSPKISKRIEKARTNFFNLIEKYEKSKRFASNRKEIEKLNKDIKVLRKRLKDLEGLEQLRIGHTICHQRQPMILGKIIGLDISQGEMPIVWVKYFRDGELEGTPTSESIDMIFTVNT